MSEYERNKGKLIPVDVDTEHFTYNDFDTYIENGFEVIDGQIYEVEILQQSKLFKGDMRLIDEIDESITYNNLLAQTFKYWNEELSSSPIFEYLFEGKCKLKNLSKIQ